MHLRAEDDEAEGLLSLRGRRHHLVQGSGLRFMVYDSGLRFMVYDSGLKVEGEGFRV